MFKRINSKVQEFFADKHMSEIAKGTILAFVLKVIGAGLAFAFNVAIARLLGAEGAGLFFLALSVTAIGSVLGRIGLDNTLLRFIATHATKGEISSVKGVYSLGMRLAVTVSCVLSLLGFLLSPWIAIEVFNKPALTESLQWMSLAILPFAILNLHGASLKGLKHIRNALLIQSISVPLLGLLLIWPLVIIGGVEGVSWSYLSATVITALLGYFIWQKATIKYKVNPSPYSFSFLLSSCKPLFITSLMNYAVLPWAPLVILGIWADSQDVGIYGAASRIAMLVSFILITINNVLAPKFAELYAKNDFINLEKTARKSTLMITFLASPLFILLIFAGEWVMMLYGSEFIGGAIILTILAIGQFVNVITGSVDNLLIVTGNELIVRNLVILGAALQIILCLILIPLIGMTGAAIGTATAVAAINISSAYLVKKKMGINITPFFVK